MARTQLTTMFMHYDKKLKRLSCDDSEIDNVAGRSVLWVQSTHTKINLRFDLDRVETRRNDPTEIVAWHYKPAKISGIEVKFNVKSLVIWND